MQQVVRQSVSEQKIILKYIYLMIKVKLIP